MKNTIKKIKSVKRDIDFFKSLLTDTKLSKYGYDKIEITDSDYIKYFEKNSLGYHQDYNYSSTSIKNGFDVLHYIKSWAEWQINEWNSLLEEQSNVLKGYAKEEIKSEFFKEILEDINGEENKLRLKKILSIK